MGSPKVHEPKGTNDGGTGDEDYPDGRGKVVVVHAFPLGEGGHCEPRDGQAHTNSNWDSIQQTSQSRLIVVS